MSQRLNILENALDKEPEKQFEQINLALQTINGWGEKIKSNLVLQHTDSINIDVNSSSLDWVDCKGMQASFKSTNNLVQYVVKVYINTNVELNLGIFVDDELIDFFKTNIPHPNTNVLNGFFNTSTGVNHSISLKWRLVSAGTATKYSSGSNKITLLSING